LPLNTSVCLLIYCIFSSAVSRASRFLQLDILDVEWEIGSLLEGLGLIACYTNAESVNEFTNFGVLCFSTNYYCVKGLARGVGVIVWCFRFSVSLKRLPR
jgi:hypothetical protein